jgi:hypothetical protein
VHELTFRDDDLRLVYLATVYHLGRPGSEIDAQTLEPHRLGLGPLREQLDRQLDQPAATVELTDYQLTRLGQALHGIANELKQYEMAQRRSAVPGFAEAMQRLFPGNEREPGTSLDLVEKTIMLRRRLDGAVAGAESAVAAARKQQESAAAVGARRPWWKLWRR